MEGIAADVWPIVLAMAGALTQHLNGGDPNPQQVWADAFRMDWDGDFNLLPPTEFTIPTINCIKSKHTHGRLMNYLKCNHIALPSCVYYNEYFSDDSRVADLSNGHIAVTSLNAASLENLWQEAEEFLPCSIALASAAVVGGHLQLLKFLETHYAVNPARLKYIPYHGYVMDIAAFNGQLEMLQHFHATGSQACSVQAMNFAAQQGHLGVVKWLYENRTEGSPAEALNKAIEHSRLDVVEYLTDRQDLSLFGGVLDIAALHGKLDVVQFLHARGSICTTAAMDNAAANGHIDIVQYLHKNRSEGCTTNAIDLAAARGHLRVVEYLTAERSEGCTTNAMDYAIANDYVDMVMYLTQNRTEGCTPKALNYASASIQPLIVLDNWDLY